MPTRSDPPRRIAPAGDEVSDEVDGASDVGFEPHAISPTATPPNRN
jgi:hypothetical protein